MKNLHITIILYKHVKLLIYPLRWFVWPRQKHIKTLKRKHIPVRVPDKENNEYFVREILNQNKVTWLCFRFYFTSTEETEVADIYPANYNPAKDPEWKERYEQLCRTEYF